MQQKVIIIGGGFGGIRTALDLAKKNQFDITLISNNPNFEYYPGLHKMLGVDEMVTVQAPLETIFKDKKVTIIIDTVTTINPQEKTVTTTKASYQGDFLVLAMGSQTEFFGISGLPEMAYGFKSVAEAQKLRTHIENAFKKHATTEKNETVVGLHMVVVGAGPNGVDLAGELASLDKFLAKKYGIAESFITIDLIEAGPRVLGMMPEQVSRRVEKRLRNLGINVLCNRELKQEDSWTVTFSDMTLGAKTVIWTAGIIANELIKKTPGLVLGKKNKITVDEYLQAQGFENVFCIGDSADTRYAGLAQTAIYDGAYVARAISTNKKLNNYVPKSVAYSIGVGPKWSVLVVGSFISFGLFPYILRTFN
jgi:NADH dehydrogenase